MSNTSATGGYLLPATAPAPLEGQDLNAFLSELVAGITGIPGPLVRPRYQAEPPNVPDAGTLWCAVGSQTRRSDTFAYLQHDPTGEGSTELQRQEQLDVLCSFYDLGTNGQADRAAALLRDGLEVPQNQEPLTLAEMALVSAPGEAIAVPSLLKQRWRYRVDITFQLNRRVRRVYPILNLLRAQTTVQANEADTTVIQQVITVEPEG